METFETLISPRREDSKKCYSPVNVFNTTQGAEEVPEGQPFISSTIPTFLCEVQRGGLIAFP